ncbi:MAG: hypothetical protein ACRESE_07375 [Gammaproteobacteria bacterium]
MLLAASAILAWLLAASGSGKSNQPVTAATFNLTTNGALTKNGFPPAPVTSHVTSSSAERKFHVIRIGVERSAALERKNTQWMNSHGCNASEFGTVRSASESTLRLWTVNGDLNAANQLGFHLLFLSAAHDERPEAKKILWQAMVNGSTCAFHTYDVFWQRARDGKRVVEHSRGGKAMVYYMLHLPSTDAAKRLTIMKDYAWDLVYEMRTGQPPMGGAAYTFEAWYHFHFRPTAAEYAYACKRANELYQTLQSDREAEGLGPFDDTPQPLALRFGDDEPKVGTHCSEWPVPRPEYQAGELHVVERDGTMNPFSVWLETPEYSTLAEQNQ